MDTKTHSNPNPTYERLAAPFDETHEDTRGGFTFTYITGEEAVSRLNEVLGFDGWGFHIIEHGYHEEADEFWCLGELTLGRAWGGMTRQQFGSQKVIRRRGDDAIIDVGFNLKGAATDALKKCASLVGVGLYLSHKEGVGGTSAPWSPSGSEGDTPVCEVCHAELTETRFKDGSVWSPATLASYGKRKHGRVLCMTDYREANEALKRKAAAGANDEVPF